MSSQNSPSKDDSTSLYNSALETLSFQSHNGSDDDSVINNITITEDNPANQSSETESIPGITNGTTPIKVYQSLEEFDKNLPQTVTLLRTPFGSNVYLVGTAHFSKESQDDVSLVIRNVRPDVVMVELCTSRIHLLRHDEKTLLEEARDINLAKIRNVISTDGVINGIFYILLLNMSAKLTKELGMAPGGEFRRAFEEIGHLQNCILQLGDRPINITLQRALHGLSFWQTLKIVWKLISSNDKINKEQVEQCKQKDLLEELMQEMADEYPAFRDVFVTERDLYLCHSLQIAAMPQIQSDGQQKPVNVVGVVGIGHSMGIAQHWGKVNSNKIEHILTIPPVSLSNRIFKFTFKYGMICLIGYGIFRVVRPKFPNIL